MKTQFLRLVTLSAAFLFLTVPSFAQDAVGNAVKQKLNAAWFWAQAILGFAIVLVTVIGALVVYSKKNSDNPSEFKKSIINYSIGVVFLVVALGIVSVLKGYVQSSTTMSF